MAGALVACNAPAKTCLAVVPKGPGAHDLAGAFGLPFNAYEALEVAAAAQCAPIDLGTLNKRQAGFLLAAHAWVLAYQVSVLETRVFATP